MKIFVVVGRNSLINNVSARAAFTKKEGAIEWIKNPVTNWFDDETEIIELELKGENND